MAIEERIAKKKKQKKKGRGSSSVGRLDVSEKKSVNNQRKREIKRNQEKSRSKKERHMNYSHTLSTDGPYQIFFGATQPGLPFRRAALSSELLPLRGACVPFTGAVFSLSIEVSSLTAGFNGESVSLRIRIVCALLTRAIALFESTLR